jgi:ankyrin repeat protein
MKKVLLALLVVVSTGINSSAANNSTNSENLVQVVLQQKVNTICKLIQLGEIDAVKNLIKNGTNVNQKSCGMTPLMYAARQNKAEIVKLLLSKGAKLKTRSDKGYTALDYARNSKATESYNLIAKAINA